MDKLIATVRENLMVGRDLWEGIDAPQRELLLNRYSEFIDGADDNGFLMDSSVRVKTLHTPRPYVHLMASNHYDDYGQWGSFWDQHRGGFSCVDTVMAGRMTSHLDSNYVPTSPTPVDVRDFYVHEAGKSWPMFTIAFYEEDAYANFGCTYGLDSYELTAVRNNIEAKLFVCVHPDEPMELWRVTLKNLSQTDREFSWFSRLRVNVDSYPFYYFVPRVVCTGEIEQGCMVFTNAFKFNKHPRAAFFACDGEFDGFDMMAEVFQGIGGRAPIPAAVQDGRCRNSLGKQPVDGLIAAGQYDATLVADGEQAWTLAFGRCPTDKAQRQEFLARIKRDILTRPDKAVAELQKVWRKKITAHAIKTPDENLNRYFNVWSKYQARNQSRFIRALDKIGYRDILQDIMGVVDFEGPYVRAKIIEAMRYQYPDGRAVRQYEKHPGGGHDLRQYQDSVVWFADVATRYIKQTGDFDFLDVEVPFLDPVTLEVDNGNTASVYEHLCRAIDSLMASPGHGGLCRIGHGDWNDSLSGIGEKMGVSVWLSCACVYASTLMAELAEQIGKADDAAKFREIAATLTARINEHAWDGRWYVYAINDDGVPIGSSENEEGKIHLNVNTWALFTGVAAAAGREQQVLDAIAVMATPVGHMLLKPAYTGISRDLVGRLADSTPGMIENASVYTHGEAFYLFALISMNRGDDCYSELQKTLLGNLAPDIVTGPPHQQSNYFVGPDSEFYGQNMFNNFTGSLSWYRVTIERMLGVVPEYDGLRIAPSVPSSWKEYSVHRQFRSMNLQFHFVRTGTPSVTLGKTVFPQHRMFTVEQLAKTPNGIINVTF